jgi:hypothetical protein
MHVLSQVHPYAGAMLVCALISFFLGTRAMAGTRKELARSFIFLQATIFVWSGFKFIEWVTPFSELRFEALQLQFLGIALMPGCSFMFAKALSKRPIKIGRASCRERV